MRNKIVTYIISLSLVTGCQKSNEGGTTTGNPLVSFKMTGSASAATVALNHPKLLSPWLMDIFKPALALPPPSMADSNSYPVTLSEAWIVVKSVEFKPSETADSTEVDGEDVTFPGPVVVDLLSNTPQSFGQGRIGTDTIRRVKMQLHNASDLPSNAPSALTGQTIYWSGAVDGHPFTISTTQGFEYEVSGPTGVLLSDNSNVLMSIQIANLFKKLNLSGIQASGTQVNIDESNRFPTTSPCPLIDNSASDIYSCFITGLKSEANLGRDDNGDDELLGEDSVK